MIKILPALDKDQPRKNTMPKTMKNYITPEIEVVELQVNDIITSSPGTETPPYEENDGIWDLSIGLYL